MTFSRQNDSELYPVHQCRHMMPSTSVKVESDSAVLEQKLTLLKKGSQTINLLEIVYLKGTSPTKLV